MIDETEAGAGVDDTAVVDDALVEAGELMARITTAIGKNQEIVT